MVSLYSKHGKHKRVAKFKSYWIAAEWINDNWSEEKISKQGHNYFFTTTKS